MIGVNVAYIPPQAHAVSIGFAIPAPTVVDVVKQLLANGKVEHAFLGIQPADVTPGLAQRFGLSVQQGAVVLDAVQGSAAATAGIKPGDVIVAFEGKKIRSVEDLLTALRPHKPGQTVKLDLIRNGKRRTVQATLASNPNG